MASEFPHTRLRPTKATLGDLQRTSDGVRASVLETALELGVGQNSTVADWIFNNPLSEEVEEEEPYLEPDNRGKLETISEPIPEVSEETTPIYTSGSNSISDESSSLNSPGNNGSSAAVTAIQIHMHKPSLPESPHVHFGDFSSDQLQLFSPFALPSHDAQHGEIQSNLLTKPVRDNERSRSQDEILRRNPARETPSPRSADAGYTSEGQYLSKGKVGKGKDKPAKSKGNKDSRAKVPDNSKTSDKDVDYASDGGYLSASSNKSQGKSAGRVKSRAMAFFRRRVKRSASDDEDGDNVPPVPALPILPRPSSPKLLERRATPSSPTRSGFSPLTLNLTSPPASPPRRRLSKSPPPLHAQAALARRSDHISVPQRPASPLVASTPAPTVLTPTVATIPLPPSTPGTPVSITSFSTNSAPKSLSASSSRQHFSLPPPAPPPTLPLPQLPQSPSLPGAPSARSRKGVSTRPVPVLPTSPGSTQPLIPRGTASPFRPLLSPRSLPTTASHARNGEFRSASEGDQINSRDGRQRSVTPLSAGLGSTPAFLQRRIQHGPPPSPRRPPPEVPLPPSPYLASSHRPRTPAGAPSKFHEHFSSVSSVPLSQILSTPISTSPSPSTATLSESSSGPSVRSSYISSVSEEPALRDSLNALEYPRPTTTGSTISESNYGQPMSTFDRPAIDRQSHFSGQSDISSSIYSPKTRTDSSSVTTCDGNDADVDDAASKNCVDEDDASVYPSDDKTAGRRTMYLVEHGELDETGDEVVIAGSHYWNDREVVPPLPSLPSVYARPGPGFF